MWQVSSGEIGVESNIKGWVQVPLEIGYLLVHSYSKEHIDTHALIYWCSTSVYVSSVIQQCTDSMYCRQFIYIFMSRSAPLCTLQFQLDF